MVDLILLVAIGTLCYGSFLLGAKYKTLKQMLAAFYESIK